MRQQSEVIIWHPVELAVYPDADTTVLIIKVDDDELELASWDDSHETWWDLSGEPINGVCYWAEVKGPA